MYVANAVVRSLVGKKSVEGHEGGIGVVFIHFVDHCNFARSKILNFFGLGHDDTFSIGPLQASMLAARGKYYAHAKCAKAILPVRPTPPSPRILHLSPQSNLA